ncbi:MAG: hypothetical protein U0797_02870 [Gemmataceae bacterium]
MPFKSPELVATLDQPALVGKGPNYEILAVRWPAFGDVHGEGLMLVPTKGKPVADIVAIPDADVTPEQLCRPDAGRQAGGPICAAARGERLPRYRTCADRPDLREPTATGQDDEPRVPVPLGV